MWLDHVDRVITFQHQPGVSAFTFTGCNHSHQIYLEGIDLHNCFPLFIPAHNLQVDSWCKQGLKKAVTVSHIALHQSLRAQMSHKEWPANSNTKAIRILLNAYLKSSNPPVPPPQKGITTTIWSYSCPCMGPPPLLPTASILLGKALLQTNCSHILVHKSSYTFSFQKCAHLPTLGSRSNNCCLLSTFSLK